MEAMIADFQRMAADLEREILAEQERAGIHLKRSIDELISQLGDAKIELQESCEELKRVELLDERSQFRDRVEDEADFKGVPGLRPRSALA
jgi:uncharacterized membrane protein